MSEEKPTMQSAPYIRELAMGRHQWCSCGRSAKQPLCDGSHRFALGEKPKPFTLDEPGQVVLCGCRRTKNPPHCDGSHMVLPMEEE